MLIRKVNSKVIKFCFAIGWLILLISLWIDLIYPNIYLWFPRSGAILCVLSLVGEFRLNQIDRSKMISNIEESLKYMNSLDTGVFPETSYEKRVKIFAHISVAVGTFVWAYGDLFVEIKT